MRDEKVQKELGLVGRGVLGEKSKMFRQRHALEPEERGGQGV